MSATFSENWHRVATRRLTLRPGVHSRRQFFRGERWRVLHDPFSNQFFRVRGPAWDFLSRLDGHTTVGDAWEETTAQFPDDAPGQEEVVQLLARLHQSNLLRSDLAPDTEALFGRYKKRQEREFISRIASILFVRIRLWDPDTFLVQTLPMVRWLFSWFGALLWIGVVALGIKTAIDNSGTLLNQAQGLLAPGNLPWLMLSVIVLKLLHEFGHAYACRHYGGEVHVFGVMILVFSPLPFVDATAAWGFRERRRRLLVGAAGMLVEFFLAAIALVIWANTAPGLMNSLAYNIVFTASVSTLLANANPLLRFDGYFMLCDAIDQPNLAQRSQRWWKYIIERFGFGLRSSKSPANTRPQAIGLAIYGAASLVYRVILFAGILWFVSGQWLIVGTVLAVLGIITWLIFPLGRMVHFLTTSPALDRVRGRAIAFALGGTAIIIGALSIIPAGNSFTVPGVVQVLGHQQVFSGSTGELAEILVSGGNKVEKGQALARLENTDLRLEQRALEAEIEETRALEQQSLATTAEGLAAIRQRLAAVLSRQQEIQRLNEELVIRAPTDGIWIAPRLSGLRGSYIQRGAAIGEIVPDGTIEFQAVVSQSDADRLFDGRLTPEGVRLPGQAENRVAVSSLTMIESRQEILPSAAMGWQAGGNIATQSDDKTGRRSAEPFFELRATLDPTSSSHLWHGRSGKLRCRLPASPLLTQWLRQLQQAFQSHNAS